MTTTYVASDLNRDVSERGDAVAAGQPQLALPETRHLPSAEGVAESNISSTRQSYNLPSAYRKTLGNKTTLGKDLLCRVPVYRHSANLPLPSATRAALGTQPHVYAAYARRARCLSRPLLFAECPQGDTRQTPLCRVPRSWHSAKTITSRGRYPLPRTLPLSFAECQVVALGKDLLMPSVIIMALGIQTLCRVSSLALGETTKNFSPTQSKLFP